MNSSEHGDGRVRSEFNERIFGAELYGAMRKVKALFDPDNLLNPGVMVDPAPMTAHLRDAELPRPKPLVTHLDFGEGGMHAAADRCQRIGACRKTGQGVMCPSYMATREEEHATRGRANALVKALSEPDPAQALGDERLHEILDLCLECKACKSECPLSRRHGEHEGRVPQPLQRDPRHAAALADVRRHPHAQPARERVRAALEPARADRAARASRPSGRGRSSSARTLIRWNRKRHAHARARPVIFLADSFTTFTEPGVGRASIELLTAAGYDVRLEHAGCCGRASISKGLLDDARAKAEALTERLQETDGPITGCEPSCLMTLREEHVQLLGDRGVAQRTRLVEELLLDADLPLRNDAPAAHPLPRPLPPEGARGHGLDGRAAAADPEHRGRRARRRLLRHGRLLRLRVRALRAVHAHRRDAPVPRGPERARGHGDRGDGRVLPPADRARHGALRAPPRADRAGRTRARERREMSQEVVSILVLVAIFAIGTLRPINMGLLGIVAAFIVGTAIGIDEDTIFAGFPGDLFIILVGVTYLFAIANNNGTVDWLVHAAVRGVGGRVAMIPWVMFLVTSMLTMVGSVVPAAVAIVAPIGLGLRGASTASTRC